MNAIMSDMLAVCILHAEDTNTPPVCTVKSFKLNSFNQESVQ